MFKAHNVIWDESVYLVMGKYLLSFGKIGFWEIIRPGGLPLLLGLIWKTGLNYIFFSELLSLLFSLGNIFVVYLIGKTILNKRLGFIASFIFAITSVFFLYSNYILSGIPSTFFLMLGIYIYLKKKNFWLSGVLCGVGALFRFPQALIMLPMIFIMYNKALKKSYKFILGFIVVHIPFFIFNYVIYRNETSKIYHALFRPWILAFTHQFNPAESIATSTLGLYLYNIFYYLIQLFRENTLFLFIIPGLIFIFRKKLYRKEGFCLILLIFIIYIVYFTIISNKQTRFLLVFLPYASIIAAYGFYHSFLFTKKDRIRIAIVLFVIISLIGVVSRDLNYYDWRLKDELPIVNDYYKFFEGHQITGVILTTDPVPAVYTDAQFVPIYFSPDVGHTIYNSYRDEIYAVIFSPESFYCEESDKLCKSSLKNLSTIIEDDNTLVFSEIYGNRAYYIYLNNDLK
ncbi:MAG: glycosyltransferase family 39 protein [Nanoarchaeota archaeon]